MNNPRSFARRGALVLALVTITSVRALAVWQSDPSQPQGFVTGVVPHPVTSTMKADGEGGVIVAWSDSRNGATTYFDIYAQRMDPQGNRLWGDAGASVAVVAESQDRPGIQPDGTGGAFIAWLDRPALGGGPIRIFAQHLAADGTAMWATNGILVDGSSESAFLKEKVAVCSDGVGGCYILVRDATATDFRLHRFDSAGNRPAGWATPLTVPSAGNYVAGLLPRAATGATGTFDVWVVGFQQGAGSISVFPVSAARTIGTAVVISHSFSFFYSAVDDQGGLWIGSGSNFDVYANRIKQDGTLAFPDSAAKFAIGSTVSPVVGTYCQGITTASGGAGIVAWTSIDNSNLVGSIRALKISATGQPLWDAQGVELASVSHASVLNNDDQVVSDGADGIIALYESQSTQIVKSQRLNSSGTALWTTGGITVNTGASNPGSLTTDASSGAIYAFTTPSFGGQRATLTGTLGSNSPSARLANISARAQIGTGGNVLIPGFVVSGGSVKLLVRGVGPTLGGAPFNVGGTITDPQLTVYNSSNAIVGSNDNWGSSSNVTEISSVSGDVGAFALPGASKDAAAVLTLSSGSYTAVTSGVNSVTGVGLVELYEADAGAGGGRLANMSVRAQVGTGSNILIPGLVIGGSGARTLLIRAIGPTLGAAPFNVAGTLADPQLTIFSGSNQIGTNDNWSSANGTQIAAVAGQVGAFPLPNNSKDAALVVTLGVGSYTVQVSGVGDTSGVCLVEVYEVP